MTHFNFKVSSECESSINEAIWLEIQPADRFLIVVVFLFFLSKLQISLGRKINFPFGNPKSKKGFCYIAEILVIKK